MTAAAYYERKLESEGLGSLDYRDGSGRFHNRGSGKVTDGRRAFARAATVAQMEGRRAILASHRFRRGERRLYSLYASGLSLRQIERKTGVGYVSVFRMVARIERDHRKAPQETLGELLSACEPRTVVLVFGLLERALSAPHEVKYMLAQARSVPALRVLIEPEAECP